LTHPPIAFQGAPGANSDLACRAVFPERPTLPCTDFEDALAAVAEGRAELAMIPIENSVAGRVADVHHLLPHSGLHIVAEHFHPVHHQLMALPGVELDEIRIVRSHVQALGQCRRYLREHGLTPVIAADTAGAAAELARSAERAVGVIASELAAEIYGLRILASDIEDAAHNTTRFVVLARAPVVPEPDGHSVTTLVFRVRSVPAALYKALGGFATNGINMTKLESYMLDGSFEATQFYLDVEAHPAERRLQLALEELRFFSVELKILGTYKGHPHRQEHP
jgi:prephenate dehydratase